MRKAASFALAAAIALGAASAQGQVLYKWVDQAGKTQYSDRPPKDFKGEVTRIEPEVDKTTLPPSLAPAAAPAPSVSPAAPAAGKASEAPNAGQDILAKRRATRARLEDRLTRAREKLEASKKALADAQTPEVDERQIVQQRSAGGGMHGMAPRSNCRTEGSGKTKRVICPSFVPTPEYHEKVARLEADVRKAEEELEAAERAWRREVD